MELVVFHCKTNRYSIDNLLHLVTMLLSWEIKDKRLPRLLADLGLPENKTHIRNTEQHSLSMCVHCANIIQHNPENRVVS